MKVLAIETSCDETAVAIVSDDKKIHAHHIYSQLEEHKPYAGVVPEIAARAHMETLDLLIEKTMKDAGVKEFSALDAIAVTAGPGLIGGVIVGVMNAKAIAAVADIPIIAVNHLEGHALTVRLTEEVAFPYLLLLLSGGHCQILVVKGVGDYERLGGTLDDALGEAYDKVAKMMKLGYPGGPIVEKLAKNGNPERFALPMPLKGRKGCDFSFSGLKTAVKRHIDALEDITTQDQADICASFQKTVGRILQDRLENALQETQKNYPDINSVVLAGGVAANHYIRSIIEEKATQHNCTLNVAPMELCTDNAAMIAWAGIERLKLGLTDDLTFIPKARWPL